VGLSDGATVEVKVSGRNLILTLAQRAYDLEELIAGITPKNRHGEADWGEPAGKETW
jgi:antitoxin MazE